MLVVEALRHGVVGGAVSQSSSDGAEAVLPGGVLDVGQELAAGADEADASAQEVACGTFLFGVGVGRREGATAQEVGDGRGVLPIVLGLAAMHRFHIKRVAQATSSCSQRSASQYQVNMHSQPTTRSSR